MLKLTRMYSSHCLKCNNKTEALASRHKGSFKAVSDYRYCEKCNIVYHLSEFYTAYFKINQLSEVNL